MLTTFPYALTLTTMVARERTTTQPPPTRCDIEERAAIMEYLGLMSRVQAEQETARLYGCRDWAKLLKECQK